MSASLKIKPGWLGTAMSSLARRFICRTQGTTVANAERRMSRDIALNKPLTRIGTKDSFAFVVMDGVRGRVRVMYLGAAAKHVFVLGQAVHDRPVGAHLRKWVYMELTDLTAREYSSTLPEKWKPSPSRSTQARISTKCNRKARPLRSTLLARLRSGLSRAKKRVARMGKFPLKLAL